MSTVTAPPPTAAAPPGPSGTATLRLAQQVLSSPERGAGIFFPAAAQGTALILGSLGVALGLLSAANAELFDPAATGIIVPVALSVGAIGIGTGGLWNFRAGSLFAGTLGLMYGTLWLSLGLLLLISAPGLTSAAGPAGFGDAFGSYLVIWSLVSFGLGLASWWVSRAVFGAQVLLAVVLLVLGLGNMAAPGGSGLIHLGGVLGLLDAAAVLYISMALIVNDTAGRDVLPLR
ncbi:hypothetical protein PAI11_32990 [Patulibacter medicamentivorans]|uniref:GPR1/FUN34/yaaH family protein n=1 Tax=Patulibacter medicamentivorans TaxID=1097667 RepID=H0E8Y5_9ACTN|nr:GPR1/FUN34/YaaH family transporter [Patulibacter medicamentivorans]EHN09885.1 hypothetical protein PAI11_32990 [Patulibacter medicamentivorans]